MSDNAKPPEMSAEMMRNTSDIAAQAAQRAQQMLRKTSIGGGVPPEVPARNSTHEPHKIPPEIPPKRHNIKRSSITDDLQKPPPPPLQKPPPPLPQKPSSAASSAQNSPHMMPKFQPGTNPPPVAMRPAAPPPIPASSTVHASPQMVPKFEKFQASPPVALKFSEQIAASPQFAMKSIASPQLSQRAQLTSSPLAAPPAKAKPVASPADDHSSEDALRGIESGLRNMERAMQEQMQARSFEQAQKKFDAMSFNPMEFKNSMRGMGGGSNSSLEATSQNIKPFENPRMGLNPTHRSMERGFSMDQMRLENLQSVGAGMNPNIRSAIEEMKLKGLVIEHQAQRPPPPENHMRSLDRSLPLELQYSRHRAQEVSDFREQLRLQLGRQQQQQQQNVGQPGGQTSTQPPVSSSNSSSASREDLRMRRRSSHDENQIVQGVPGKYKYSHFNNIFSEYQKLKYSLRC